MVGRRSLSSHRIVIFGTMPYFTGQTGNAFDSIRKMVFYVYMNSDQNNPVFGKPMAVFLIMLLPLLYHRGASAYAAAGPSDRSGLDATGGIFSGEKYKKLIGHDQAGTLAYNKNDFRSAQKEFQASVELSAEIFGETSSQTARRYYSLGLASYHQGAYDRALDAYTRALGAYRLVLGENDFLIAFCYHGLGQCHQSKGNYDMAVKLYSRALDIYGTDHERSRQYAGMVYYDMGVAYQYKGEYKRAEDYLNKALGLSRKIFGDDHAYLATVYYALGETAKFKGNYDSALEYYQKALGIYLKSYGDNHPYVGTAYYAMAYAYENRGEYAKAVTYYERARRLYTSAYGEKHPHVAIAYHGLGNAYNTMGEYDKAIPCFNKAIEINLAIFGENHINVAASLSGLGKAHLWTGRYDEALVFFERMLAIQKKVLGENHPETGHCYSGIGMVLANKGAYDLALKNFERSRAIFAGTLGEDHPLVSNVLLQVGRIYYTMNDAGRGRSYVEKALAQYRGKSLYPQSIQASDILGIMYLDSGDSLKARSCFEESIRTIEKARVEAGADKVEFMRRYIESYYYSLKSSAVMNDIEAVFNTAESMRARGFLDRMSLGTALSVDGITKKDRDRLIALNDDIESLALRRRAEIDKATSAQDNAALVGISMELERKEKAFGELDAKLMANEKYRSLRKPHIATLEEARRICGGDSAILEYVIWEEKDKGADAWKHRQSYCLVITGRGQKLVPLDREFDYTGTIARFRDSIIDQNKKKDRETLAVALHEKLITPLEQELAGRNNIIIVPDGALAFLPFDALMKKDAGSYLCETYSVTLSPSVSVLLMVQKRQFSSERMSFLAFGGAVYSSGKGEKRGKHRIVQDREVSVKTKVYRADEGNRGRPLYYRSLGLQWDNIPGTLDEVSDIEKSIYHKKNTRVIKGRDVSELTIKELSKRDELSRYKSIHFACHGYYDADLPSFSAVVVSEVSGTVSSSEDGYLSVPEVALLKLKADIVNLSACETGLGKIVQGDGIIGLARAFQEAGANRVGVTLWEVADEPTRNFMVGVYRRAVRENMPFGDAVTNTKREFIRSPEYRDPYFWSSFVLYGR